MDTALEKEMHLELLSQHARRTIEVSGATRFSSVCVDLVLDNSSGGLVTSEELMAKNKRGRPDIELT